jgi:hypothetical protein
LFPGDAIAFASDVRVHGATVEIVRASELEIAYEQPEQVNRAVREF